MVALQKSYEFTNSALESDEYISRGRKTDVVKKESVSSKSRCDFNVSQIRTTSDCHSSLYEDEKIPYKAEIRHLCTKIELLKLEDSGVIGRSARRPRMRVTRSSCSELCVVT